MALPTVGPHGEPGVPPHADHGQPVRTTGGTSTNTADGVDGRHDIDALRGHVQGDVHRDAEDGTASDFDRDFNDDTDDTRAWWARRWSNGEALDEVPDECGEGLQW